MKKLYFRFFLTVLVLLPLVLLSSCFGSDFADLKVSASQTQFSAKAIYNTLEYNVDSELLKDEVKGTPEFVVTPSTYILDIDRIRLFNPIDKEDVTKGAKESFELISVTCFDSGYIVPKRYNMLSSKGIATFSLPMSLLKKDWHGLSLMIRPGGNEGTNGMWAGSIIGVRKDSLPSGVDENNIVNTVASLPFGIEYPDDCVWFSFYDLLPFNLGGMLAYITFSDSAEEVHLINPLGEDGFWKYGAETSGGNQSGAIFPMETLNLKNMVVPEIVISIDTKDLIEFYRTDDGNYYAAFTKENPFPFRVFVDEYDPSVYLYSEQAVTDIDDAAPFDCFDYAMTTRTGFCHILVHTQANYSGISFVEVFRSEKDVFDEDAKLIYWGNELSIIDRLPSKYDDVHYYIRTVDLDGKKSGVKRFERIDTSCY